MAELRFELVTPERQVMSADVHMVVVPGSEGEFGVMAIYRSAGAQPERIAVSGGFAEVGDKGLTVLAEKAGETAAA